MVRKRWLHFAHTGKLAVFVHAVMTSSFALLHCVGCIPHVTFARQAPYRLCNAQRVHSQRQLISLRSFTSQQPAQSRCSQIKTQAGLHGDDWSTAPDSYLTLVCLPASKKPFPSSTVRPIWSSGFLAQGLAHCFEKKDDGKLQDKFVIEPITANSLECMAAGAFLCYLAFQCMQNHCWDSLVFAQEQRLALSM